MRAEKVILIALTVSILLGAPILMIAPATGDEQITGQQSWAFSTIDSDYIVYPGEIKGIDNEQWIMDANIEVQFGGTLYINNTHILWGGDRDGEYGLYVRNGGMLYIDRNCNFTANDTTTYIDMSGGVPWDHTWGIHWKFEIYGGAYIANSTLSYMWGDNGNYLQNARGGIQCYSDDIKIYNVDIFNVEQAGIYTGDASGSTTLGYDIDIDQVWISNSTGWGVFAAGSGSQLSLTNATIIGNPYRGIQYFYGAGGRFDHVEIYNCGDVGMTFDPITAGSMTIRNSTFAGNKYGYSARRGGTVTLYNCHFDRNTIYGLELAHDTGYTQTVYVYGGTAKNNVVDGIGTTYDSCPAWINDMEIAYNGRHGVFVGAGSGLDVNLDNCKIYENAQYGFVNNGSAGSLTNSEIYNNPSGNVLLANGASTSVGSNVINSTATGIRVGSSDSQIRGNRIVDNEVGLHLSASASPDVLLNDFENNEKAMNVFCEGITLTDNNFRGNTDYGIILNKCDSIIIDEGEYTNNNIGIYLIGGDQIEIRNIDLSGSIDTGIMAEEKANFTITNPSTTTTTMASDAFTRALYQFNEGTGNTIRDFSPNGNDGVLSGSPLWVEGKWGNALKFNGVDQYANVQDSPSLDIDATDLSVEAWIRVDQANLESRRMIVDKEESFEIALTADRHVTWAIMTETMEWYWVVTDAQV
ncbi:MAG: right-handed parallel beta-helix repeat-containing protein, partial [Thermoplasmatota archaeon]